MEVCRVQILCVQQSVHGFDVNICVHSLVQSVRVLRLPVLKLQQLHEALQVPDEANRSQRSASTQARHKPDCLGEEPQKNLLTTSGRAWWRAGSAGCRAAGWLLSWSWPAAPAAPYAGTCRRFSHMHSPSLRRRRAKGGPQKVVSIWKQRENVCRNIYMY